ncbi:DUF2079 domain-containing protein [Macrococcus equi]|uniref:DUF2079 domain-containing protein n=1 Tax=Macrococcus equi TaxID=3395462 RepID=UPI0039BEAD03
MRFNLSKFKTKITHNEKWIDHLFFILMSAYMIYALISIFTVDDQHLYFELFRPQSYFMFIAVITFIALWMFTLHRFISLTTIETFCLLNCIFLIGASIKAPSPTITVGFLLIAIIISTKLMRVKSPWMMFSIFTCIVLFIKTASIFRVNGASLQKFNYSLTDKDIALIKAVLTGTYVALFIITTIIVYKYFNPHKFTKTFTNNHNEKRLWILTLIIGLSVTLYVSIIMIGKELVMGFATYDKGLFTQMFESMRNGYGPMTTLERDKWMTHFHVHISPIFYILLPFYMLVPKPETIEVLQVVVTMSGIIPFYFILKHFKFNVFLTHLCLMLFILTPTLTSSHLYGLHENCFLTPMLFWLILANLKQWNIRLILIVIITLLIKEDSMIYVLTVGLFFIFNRQFTNNFKRRVMIVLTQILLPLIYFMICLYYLNTYGDGSMTTRFTNFMLPGQSGLKDVIINILLNPVYFLSAIFTFNKIKYIITLIVAMGFLPIIQKSLINYILLLPMLVINLLSDFPYQVDFGFQYHYGSTALLLFMTILTVNSFVNDNTSTKHEAINPFKNQTVYYGLIAACIISASIFFTLMQPSTYGIKAYLDNPNIYQSQKNTLKQIPSHKNILTYGFYTTQLAHHKNLFDLDYHNDKQVDKYIDYVVAPRTLLNQGTPQSQLIQQYSQSGYKESKLSSETILILKK